MKGPAWAGPDFCVIGNFILYKKAPQNFLYNMKKIPHTNFKKERNLQAAVCCL